MERKRAMKLAGKHHYTWNNGPYDKYVNYAAVGLLAVGFYQWTIGLYYLAFNKGKME
jgi:hypothetical protein